MARTMRLSFFPSIFVAALILVGGVCAAPNFPALTGRVVDQAALLNAETESRIDAKLAELEAKTTTQLVVVTLRSLGGYDLSDYGYQLARAWGIGQRGMNNWRVAYCCSDGAEGSYRGRLWARGSTDGCRFEPDYQQRHSPTFSSERFFWRNRTRRRRSGAGPFGRRRGF